MGIYIDTSALVAIYITEQHTEAVLHLLQEETKNFCISRLVEVEFFSTIARKHREKNLSLSDAKNICALFKQHISQLKYEIIHLTDTTYNLAIQYLSTHKTNLRTQDALHLACSELTNTTLLTLDSSLIQSAIHFNIPIKYPTVTKK